MAKCCPICYRLGLEVPTGFNVDSSGCSDARDLQERFFRLLERYVGVDRNVTNCKYIDEGEGTFDLEKCSEFGMVSCWECFQLMESFCNLFHQLKTIELSINWKLGTLIKIMKAGEKVPSRVKYFKECLKNQNKVGEGMDPLMTSGNTITESVIGSRRSLIKKCSQKLKHSCSFPKLSIVEWKSQNKEGRSEAEPVPQQNDSIETVNIGSYETAVIPSSVPEHFSDSDLEKANSLITPLGTPQTVTYHPEPEISIPESHARNMNYVASSPETASTAKASSDGVDFQNDKPQETSHDPRSETDDERGICPAADDPNKKFHPNEGKRKISALSPLGLKVEATTSSSFIERSPSHDNVEGEDDEEDISYDKKPSSTQKKDCNSRKCSTCGKVFSNVMRLQNHIEEAHDKCDSESSLWTSSSDESSWASSEDGEQISRQSPPRSPVPGPSSLATVPTRIDYFLKCPDCNLLFEGTKSLLLHRKESESCAAFYDSGVSIRVEVLVPSEEASAQDVYAVINLPQAILICEQCDLPLYSGKDMEEHKKLHGGFSCNFCDFSDFHALTICRHELQHTPRRTNQAVGKFRRSQISCPRCNFTGHYYSYQQHFFTEHLSLPWNKPAQCPICKTHLKTFTKRGLLAHFSSHHDVRDLGGSKGDILHCTVQDCTAYFLIGQQLQHHLRQRHDVGKIKKEDTSKFQLEKIGQRTSETDTTFEIRVSRSGLRTVHRCANCKRTFSSTTKLEEHQKSHESEKVDVSVPISSCGEDEEDEDDDAQCLEQSESGPSRQQVGTNAKHFQLKCPGCGLLFDDFKTLLLHRKNSESCSIFFKPDESIKVEVLIPQRKQEKVEEDAEPDNSILHAVIELRQTIFICEHCDMTIYSKNDKEEHKKLHGSFSCNFCDFQDSYALNIATHELQRHAKRKSTGLSRISCPRCKFTGPDYTYQRHFVKEHLSLTLAKPKCPICKAHVKKYYADHASELLRHVKSHHDVTDERVGVKGLAHCNYADCTAYFLTTSQLMHHIVQHHVLDNNKEKMGKSGDGKVEPGDGDTGSKIDVEDPERPLSKPNNEPNKHAVRKLPKQPYSLLHSCKINNCSCKFYSKEGLQQHSQLHGNFPCPFCEASHTYAPDLAWHEITEHSNDSTKNKFTYVPCGSKNIYPCPRPNCTFQETVKEAYISHHLADHMGLTYKSTFSCEVCNAKFGVGVYHNTNRNIQYHFDTHHNLDKLENNQTAQKCDEGDCSAYFLTMRQLRLHKIHVHKSKASYSCSSCNISYKNMQTLIRHKLKYHEKELDFPCTFSNCDHRSTSKIGLGHHISKMHTNKRRQVNCPNCGKLCAGELYLKMHMEVHKKDVGHKWICEICAKEFKIRQQLETHSLSHSGPESWEFMCSVCSKKCLTKQKLREHMRTHTKEKAFVCQICGEKYAHRHNLRNHVNSNHGDQVQDIPKTVHKPNMTSRKGIKRSWQARKE